MSEQHHHHSGGIGIAGALFILFVALKLTGWLSIAAFVGFLLGVVLIGMPIVWVVDRRRCKRERAEWTAKRGVK